MKKSYIISGLVAAVTLTSGASAIQSVAKVDIKKTEIVEQKEARPTKIVSVDSIRMLRESREGKKLESEIQGEVKSFEEYIRKANNELVAEQESLTKQAQNNLLSKDVLQDQADKLMRLKKDKQREIESRRETLSESIQSRQVKLREKQLVEAREVLVKQGWELMVEKHAPFVLAVSPSIDKTDDVIKAVNEKYEGSNKSKKNVA